MAEESLTEKALRLLVLKEFTPALAVWEYVLTDEDNITIIPGDDLDIVSYHDMAGWLIGAWGTTNDPDTRIVIRADENVTDATPKGYYLAGRIMPNPLTPYVSKYDTTNNIYSLMFNPSPYRPFNNEIMLKMYNTSTSAIVVGAGMYFIKFKEEVMNAVRDVWESV